MGFHVSERGRSHGRLTSRIRILVEAAAHLELGGGRLVRLIVDGNVPIVATCAWSVTWRRHLIVSADVAECKLLSFSVRVDHVDFFEVGH